MYERVGRTDPEILEAILGEADRQETGLEMIASENFASPAVLEAMASVLTNKYAEGYPGRRYYGGCEFVDRVETLAIERAKALFSAEHANVQPHSGSSANMAAYLALVPPGGRIMGMRLDQGGHLTHGHKVNFSGILFEASSYGVRVEDGLIDYDELERLAREKRPALIVTGASAYPRRIDFERVGGLAKEIGAYHLADIAHYAGLVVAGLYPSPVPHADLVTTTTHKTLRGPRSGLILSRKEHARAVDKAVFPGVQGGPLEHVIAAKAVAFREAGTDEFRSYQERVIANARSLAEVFLDAGFDLVSGGTDCHLVLLDLKNKDVDGRTAEAALEEAAITVNKNAVPGDPRPPVVTSGIRIGTPALTTRGMGEEEMRMIGRWIVEILEAPADAERKRGIRGKVLELTREFPLYG